MTKRAVCLILALILPIVMLCGCSGERLTLEEYKTEVSAAVPEWTKAMMGWSAFMATSVIDDNNEIELEKVKKHKATLEEKLRVIKKALDKIDKIGNPPEEYDELHKKMKDAVSIERKWLKYQRELMSAKSQSDCKAAEKKIEKLLENTDDTLPLVYVEMKMKWKDI